MSETPPAPKNGLIFEAIPADGKAVIKVEDSGKPVIVWPNRLALPPKIKTIIENQALRFVFPPNKPGSLAKIAWIINVCADADEYQVALQSLSSFSKGVPVFNHPDGVLRTRRDLMAKGLEGVEGLEVPNCVRFSPQKLSDFKKTFTQGGFDYPVLVRPERSQTGREVVKVDNVDDWQQFEGAFWKGRSFYMTQFVDFAEPGSSGEPEYFKLRLEVIGNMFTVCHALTSSSWMVHYKSPHRTSTPAQEWDFVQKFSKDETIKKIVHRTLQYTGLDYIGIDLGYIPSRGTFVFFEATPAMSVLNEPKPSDGKMEPEFVKYRQAAENVLLNLLLDRSKWGTERAKAAAR